MRGEVLKSYLYNQVTKYMQGQKSFFPDPSNNFQKYILTSQTLLIPSHSALIIFRSDYSVGPAERRRFLHPQVGTNGEGGSHGHLHNFLHQQIAWLDRDNREEGQDKIQKNRGPLALRFRKLL